MSKIAIYIFTANNSQNDFSGSSNINDIKRRQLLPKPAVKRGGRRLFSPPACLFTLFLYPETQPPNVIIDLYCKSSKPYVVYNSTGNDRCLSHLLLTRLHHLSRSSSATRTGNSIFFSLFFTPRNKVAKSSRFYTIETITCTDSLHTMHIGSTTRL